jgi:hypothetical protein
MYTFWIVIRTHAHTHTHPHTHIHTHPPTHPHTHRFDNEADIVNCHSPTLIIHGRQDGYKFWKGKKSRSSIGALYGKHTRALTRARMHTHTHTHTHTELIPVRHASVLYDKCPAEVPILKRQSPITCTKTFFKDFWEYDKCPAENVYIYICMCVCVCIYIYAYFICGGGGGFPPKFPWKIWGGI